MKYADPPGEIGSWREVRPDDRQTALHLRRQWHTAAFVEEPALRWLPAPGQGTPAVRPWRDRVIPMAVRLELRTAAGYLIATSDRLMGGAGRTPAQLVWGDHRFGYVLMVLRLLLIDMQDQPASYQPYRLHVDGETRRGVANELGMIEHCPPVGVDVATLEVLGDDDDADPCFTFELKIGLLDEAGEVSGARARLNNLGVYAGEPVEHPADECFELAVSRFQAWYGLPVTGELDQATLARLERMHQVGPERSEDPAIIGPAGPPV